MKKKTFFIMILVLVITTIPLLANAATLEYNENFSIRGGIGYGSSKEQVSQIEKNNGSVLKNDWDDVMEQLYGIKKSDLRYNTVLAGHDVLIYHYFNSQNELEEFHYCLTPETYKDITPSLIEKYGEAQFQGDNRAPFSTKALAEYEAFKGIGEKVSLYDYRGWLLQYNDCYVLIEAANSNVISVINYHFISYEEMEETIDLLKEADTAKKESIKNDI